MKFAKMLSCIMVVIILLSCISSASAEVLVYEICSHNYHTYRDKKLTDGVGNYGNNKRYYWVDPSFSSNYKDRVYYAFKFWTYTSDNPGVTTSISIKESSLQSDSTFDIHKTSLEEDVTGMAVMYYYQTEIIDISSHNWTWAEIHIDQAQTVDYPNPQRVGLIQHEIGHAMGLSHQNTLYDSSLMYPYNGTRVFPNGDFRNRPSVTDCNHVNHLYG